VSIDTQSITTGALNLSNKLDNVMVSTSNSPIISDALDAFTELFNPENAAISLDSNVALPFSLDIASVLILQFLCNFNVSAHTGFGSTTIPFHPNTCSNMYDCDILIPSNAPTSTK
jgi:hypothetical protein